MKKKSLFLFALVISISSYSQNLTSNYDELVKNLDVLKPTLFSFQDYSINEFVNKISGCFNYQVPIHTIQTKYLNIPIGIYYNSSIAIN
jgi:hypothetical protein